MGIDFQPSCAATSASHPYASSISSSASSSSSSVFSADGTLSQASTTSSSHVGWDSEDGWTCSQSQPQLSLNSQSVTSCAAPEPLVRVSTFPQLQPKTIRRSNTSKASLPPLKTADLSVPADQRQHPRRSSTVNCRAPPTLVRQSERKVNFVDSLVVSATQMVEVIWPLSVPTCPGDSGKGVLPLRTFIQETLRRSRTSYSTLQVALYYLILIKSHVPAHDFTMEQPADMQSLRALQCGRRMFLAALILASKYLQDRNFSSRAWSKISGLKVCEINTNEMAFLQAVNWKLHITEPVFERWQQVVLKYTPSQPPSSPGGCVVNAWRSVIPRLTPELEFMEAAPWTPVRLSGPEFSLPPRSPLGVCGSQESTPTPSDYKLPRFLEPKPEMLPPTPTLPRMAPLPTPMLTPQSAASSTPAASGLAYGSRRPSMCSAMAQAQSASLARSAMDWNPAFGATAFRRPSNAPSASSSSSPESMVSDSSSRSSRASSISSVSSTGWAPNQANLARLATCRNARLPYPAALPKRKDSLESSISEMMSPDLESFHIEEESIAHCGLTTPSRLTSATDDGSKSRKRGRSSVDLSLQMNVRSMLAGYGSPSPAPISTVLPDRSVAKSGFLSSQEDRIPNSFLDPKALQSPTWTAQERRLPIQKDLGRKRCCASEAALALTREQGPGMWEGIL